MLLQIPIFISLFHVLRHLSNSVSLCHADQFHQPEADALRLHRDPDLQAAQAKLFGAPLAGVTAGTRGTRSVDCSGGDVTATRVVIIVLVVISAAATFYTQIAGSPVTGNRSGRDRGDRPAAHAGRHPGRACCSPACSSRSVCCSTGSRATSGPWANSSTSTSSTRTFPKRHRQQVSSGRALPRSPGRNRSVLTDGLSPRRPKHRTAARRIRRGQSRRRDSVRGRRERRIERIRATVEHTASGTTAQPAGRGQFEPPGREASESVQKATVIAP